MKQTKRHISGACCAVRAAVTVLVTGVLISGNLAGHRVFAAETLTCTQEEHAHTDACYQQTLICGQTEAAAHTHQFPDCYTLTCTKEEGHTHTDACYDANGTLTCTKEENHTHSLENGCYTLTCGQAETAGHTHTESCYQQTLICGLAEHTHTDACYAAEDTAETEVSTQTETEIQTETAAETNTGFLTEPLTEAATETETGSESKKKKETETEKQTETETETETAIIGFSVDPSIYPAANITENTLTIYKMLREKFGMNHAAACGVLANIQCESNFSPLALGDGGTSYGLCQWHLGRFNALISYCNANGLDYNTLDGQMAFLYYELTTGYANVYSYLLNVQDSAAGAYEAAYYWCMYFEMPSSVNERSQQRGNMAQNEYYPQEFKIEEETEEKEEAKKETVQKPASVGQTKEIVAEQITQNIQSFGLTAQEPEKTKKEPAETLNEIREKLNSLGRAFGTLSTIDLESLH